MWGDADPEEVKRTWADELTGFAAEDVRWALGALKTIYLDYPPTLPQFVGLCKDGRKVRTQTVVRLPEPLMVIDQAKVDEAVAQVVGRVARDPKAWARRIREREAKGVRQPMIALSMAKEALAIPLGERE